MKFRTVLACVFMALMLQSCSGLFLSGERDDFVRVKESHFILQGMPYYYAGTNLWYGCYIGSPGSTGDRLRLRRELDSLCSIGLTNLRILAASEESYLTRSVRPAIQRAPGDLDDSLMQGLDYLLAEMGKRKMRAVLYLNNYWQWSGGMAAYNVWADGGKGADPDNPAEGYRAFMVFSAKFYTNPKANELFRNFLKTIITRRNTVNGRSYAEDPTIMAWQLANEPRPGPGGDSALVPFCLWIDQTAEYIHQLDANHLVSSGSEGTITTNLVSEPFVSAHRSKNIDYLTFHIWPFNWRWFDPRKIDETLPLAEEKVMKYIDQHMKIARELNRPIVLEEFGIPRDSGLCAPGSPTTARDQYYMKVMGVLYDSARVGAPYAGSNFWGWGGFGAGRSADNVWRTGDPFTGDPPQEAQGLNSVFVTDTSTVRILREHARNMMRLVSEDSLHAVK